MSQFILNDVDSLFSSKNRIQFDDHTTRKWNYYSSATLTAFFPKIETYLNISPNLEFSHLTNHTSGVNTTRLTEYYIDFLFNIGRLSIGQKKLSFESGRFISDSRFSLLPRTFNLISYKSPEQTFEIYYLFHTISPTSSTIDYFERGSYILALHNLQFLSPLTHQLHIYILENIADTLSINTQQSFFIDHHFSTTIAYQTPPSIKTRPVSKSSSLFHDAIYTYSHRDSSVTLGTRFFQSGSSHSSGFSATFSSGHRWDGFLNVYHHQTKYGYDINYRSIFGSFSTKQSNNRLIKLDWHLFRDHLLTKNLGAEIDVAISDTFIKNTIYWQYKIGQFISGNNTPPSNLMMWLDFQISLNNPI